MRKHPFLCLAFLAALPASAQETAPGIELIAGHPIHHDGAQQAGVAMALSIIPDRDRPSDLVAPCEELRIAAGLADDREGLRLETIFVVPRKATIRKDATFSVDGVLYEVRGRHLANKRLDLALDPFTGRPIGARHDGKEIPFSRCDPTANARRSRGEVQDAVVPSTRFDRIAGLLAAARTVRDE